MAPLTNKCVGRLDVERSDLYNPLKTKYNPCFHYGPVLDIGTWLREDKNIQKILSLCEIPAFLNLSCTNANNYANAYLFLNNRKLTHVQLCPNLTILNPFNIDTPINLFKILKWYHKLEPTVENGEGITLQIRPKLSLNQWIEGGKKMGIALDLQLGNLETDGNCVEEGKVQWEMMSNGLVKGTRSTNDDKHLKIIKKMGYHERPHENAYLHNIIFTQKVFGKCLFCLAPKESPFGPECALTLGRTSTNLLVGATEPPGRDIDFEWDYEEEGYCTDGLTPGYIAVTTEWNYDATDIGSAGLKKM